MRLTVARLLSVGYGRPPLVSSSHVKLEPTSFIAFSNVRDETVTSSLAYFDAILYGKPMVNCATIVELISCSSLTHIMGDAVDRLYGQNLGSCSPVLMDEILRQISGLLWHLERWKGKLPGHLKVISSSKDMLGNVPFSLETTRFRVLLSLRYLGARVLVLRAILGQVLPLPNRTTSNEDPSEWLLDSAFPLLVELTRTCSNLFQISRDLLVASRNNQNLQGAWWFSCYYSKQLVSSR